MVALGLAAFGEFDLLVTRGSTIRVKQRAESVRVRFIGERVRVRILEERLEVRHAAIRWRTLPRLRGRNRHSVEFCYATWSLVRTPGAFEHYGYRAYLDYLRVLHLAALGSRPT